ncbi:glycosyltransferase [Flavisolibacter ginsenosidimutans]|uniref:Glycosyltransferase n=1 Tax=Flavisolibacter ginsenosidimutans TaxID=661481 RepID=A0A5B8UIH2_9BACT|nr:glycosyltransferase [Flavisolibacter ginsenosidimutans]QEC56474.1 glycosyltransferase [Flavisolibacter ginsenosidimutans]
MTVSVIITCYNLEKYIEPAILSVLNQTRTPDEIIVVDDCSTDASANVIQKYSDRLCYLRLPENSGVLQATLAGINKSTGSVISFLDGDDVWLPQKLAEVMSVFEKDEKVVLVSHNYEIIDSDGKPTGQTDSTQKNLERITKDNPDKVTLSNRVKDSILGYKGIWLGSAYCFRRAGFDVKAFEAFLSSFTIPGFKRLCYQDHPMAQFIVLTNPPDSLAYLVNKVLFQYRIFGLNSSGVSNTLNSALKTIEKGSANMAATSALVDRYPHLKEAQNIQKWRKMEFEYLKALYTKNYKKAVSTFMQLSLNSWDFNRKVKEFKRLGGVILLGPEKFLAVKSRS